MFFGGGKLPVEQIGAGFVADELFPQSNSGKDSPTGAKGAAPSLPLGPSRPLRQTPC